MLFESFVEIYLNDLKPRLKYNTYLTKIHIIENKALPFFKNKSIAEISPTDVLQWQNELLKKSDKEGKHYSQTYLRTVQNQLNAILNHAHKYYDLIQNPAYKTSKMRKNKPISFYAFEILFCYGIREGELLALTKSDFDLEKETLNINKSYQRLKSKDSITFPKTEKVIEQFNYHSFYVMKWKIFSQCFTIWKMIKDYFSLQNLTYIIRWIWVASSSE